MHRARSCCLALALVAAAVLPGFATSARAAGAAGAWIAAAPMSAGRVEHTATLLPDGQVLVSGLVLDGARPLRPGRHRLHERPRAVAGVDRLPVAGRAGPGAGRLKARLHGLAATKPACAG